MPPFLIASITSLCNLHCSGCYARSVNTCEDGEPVGQLDAEEWRRVFREAGDLGVGFIILLGGEPLVRKDVIREAAKMPDILFPVFTNGTMITEEYLQIFDSSRNLAPVLSIEGGMEKTDARRGRGIYGKLSDVMAELKKRNILFGISSSFPFREMRKAPAAALRRGAGFSISIRMEARSPARFPHILTAMSGISLWRRRSIQNFLRIFAAEIRLWRNIRAAASCMNAETGWKRSCGPGRMRKRRQRCEKGRAICFPY